jgi:hypothetical protein
VTDRSSTDWDVQDSGSTDWREDVRQPPSSEGNVDQLIVESVFDRSGTVTAQIGDYESAQVVIDPALSTARPWGDVRLYLSNLSDQVDANATSISLAMPKAGGAFTGAVTLVGDATAALQPASKQQLDGVNTTATAAQTAAATADSKAAAAQTAAATADSKAVAAQDTATAAMPKSGGAFTGMITLSGDATAALQPVSKQQLDAAVPTPVDAMLKSGGTFTGPIVLSGDATVALNPASKQQLDAVNTIAAAALPKAGGTMTGALTLSGNGTLALHAATKQQMDAADAALMPKAGGTFTGAVTLSADAASALQPATKQQLDAVSTAATTGAQAALSAADNLIHNGGMEIWQRGTSFGPTSGAVLMKTADRWQVVPDTGATVTVSQLLAPVAPISTDEQRRSILTLNRTVAGSGVTLLWQPIEGVRTGAGQSLTVSFEINTSIATSGMWVQLTQYMGTGGSPSANVATAGPTFSTALTTWERKTFTIALPNLQGKTLGTNGDDALRLYLLIPASVGVVNVNITNVDVRLGPTAPAKFLRRPYQEELALCQRYYQKLPQVYVSGYNGAAGIVFIDYPYLVQMRATPTVSFAAIGYANASAYAAAATFAGHIRLQATITATGAGAGAADLLLDAEL